MKQSIWLFLGSIVLTAAGAMLFLIWALPQGKSAGTSLIVSFLVIFVGVGGICYNTERILRTWAQSEDLKTQR